MVTTMMPCKIPFLAQAFCITLTVTAKSAILFIAAS